MRYTVNLKDYRPSKLFSLGDDFSGTNPAGDRLSFNNFFMERNGKPFYPVSGEFHYSRMDTARWEDELIKMRMGGVNVESSMAARNEEVKAMIAKLHQVKVQPVYEIHL